MRNPTLKLVNKIKDSDLLKNVLVFFQRSKIRFKNEDQLLQSIGLANIRIGMAQSHMFLEESSKEHQELKHYQNTADIFDKLNVVKKEEIIESK